MSGNIEIRGARVNNLKNVNLDIPRGQLVVISGLSGSGKSSLAFDTLYAEGRRRYVESLSAYARQFMGKMQKPDCDSIKGLPPAVAIEQKVVPRNPRSTVGTSTEIYDYLRLLFGRIGVTYSPISGTEVKKNTIEDVIQAAHSAGLGTRIAIAAPITLERSIAEQLDILQKEGYSRIICNNKIVSIAEALAPSYDWSEASDVYLLIDRTTVSDEADEISRLAESVETAFIEGVGVCSLFIFGVGEPQRLDFSKMFEADGMTFEEPNEQLFNFNSPYGACPHCQGLGRAYDISPECVIPDDTRSVYQDAVSPWRDPIGKKWMDQFIAESANNGFPIHRPYFKLTKDQKQLLWKSIDNFFEEIKNESQRSQYRFLYARYERLTKCRECNGTRLRKETEYVRVGGKTIGELTAMPVGELAKWFENLHLCEHDAKIAERILREINNRLRYLVEVGLDYLTLSRSSDTLSGGEFQRINLSTTLGSSLVGSLYILDEPSIGLHSRDTDKLIRVLRKLQKQGNTVVVVEHDEEVIRSADMIIDVGPEAGSAGGEIVFAGSPDNLHNASQSYTAKYLTGELSIPVPTSRRRSRKFIEVTHANKHNLKDISVKFPLHTMTVVTGVSGSGKSTLIKECFVPQFSQKYQIVMVDQTPIGRSSRSNAATYLGAFDVIRELFANLPTARTMGFPAAFFSFNTEGGRCEACKGDGFITIPMQFLADVTIPCEVCGGKRYKKEILDITYRDKTIADILDMSVDEAIAFFSEEPDNTPCVGNGQKFAARYSAATLLQKMIVQRLQPLADVGLGYIKLGQPSANLSGGENQRVKIASYLSNNLQPSTIFVFDEPTTGLHLHDIAALLSAFDKLLAKGHTVIIIEHNLEVIKCADYVIDLGPEGGDNGGQVIAVGTPEKVAANPKSLTGQYLRKYLS